MYKRQATLSPAVADNTIVLEAMEGRKAPIILPSNIIEALGLTPTVKGGEKCCMYARTIVTATGEVEIEGLDNGTPIIVFLTEAFINSQGDEITVATIKDIFSKDAAMSVVNTHSNGTELRTGTKKIRNVINELHNIGDGEITMEVALLPDNAGFYIVGVQEVAVTNEEVVDDSVVEETAYLDTDMSDSVEEDLPFGNDEVVETTNVEDDSFADVELL